MSWTKFSKLTLFAVTIAFAHLSWAADKKDCVECTYKRVVGAPDLGGLEKLAKVDLSKDELNAYQLSYCMKFEQVSNNYGFKKDIIESMKKSPYSFDQYWITPGCTPKRIGNTDAPIIHLAAEDAGGRMQFIQTLYKTYQERKDNAQWLKVVNAKNSRGHTLLDYIDYLSTSGTFRDEEKSEVNEFITFLCERGATFSVSNNRKCPMKI